VTDGEERALAPAGTLKFLQAVQVDAASVEALMLAFHCGCRSPGYFTHDEFIMGLTRLNCDTTDKLTLKAARFKDEAKERLDEVWKWVFDFLLEKAEAKVRSSSEPLSRCVALSRPRSWSM